MNKRTRTALLSLGVVAGLAAAAFAATPAKADVTIHYGPAYRHHQPVYSAPVLNERQLHRRIAHQGYRQVGPLHWGRGGYVVTRGVDHWGRVARLTVSPRTGQIVDARYHF